MADTKAPSGVSAAYKFFGKGEAGTLAGFAEEWKRLTDADKEQLTKGLSDGSLSY